MQTEIRPLAEKDLDRVSQIEAASFSMPWKREDFKDLIESEHSVYMVITLDGLVIGSAGYTYNGFEGYINNVVIDSEYRGKGYSAILMEGLLNHGVSQGIMDYTLEVRVSNTPAIKLYEKLGFESAGVRKNFYERPTEDAFVMWLHK